MCGVGHLHLGEDVPSVRLLSPDGCLPSENVLPGLIHVVDVVSGEDVVGTVLVHCLQSQLVTIRYQRGRLTCQPL